MIIKLMGKNNETDPMEVHATIDVDRLSEWNRKCLTNVSILMYNNRNYTFSRLELDPQVCAIYEEAISVYVADIITIT